MNLVLSSVPAFALISTLYLANVRAYKSCEYADCHCHFVNRSSAVTSDSFSRLFTSLSVSSRSGPSNLVQSHVEQNLVLDQSCEPTPARKGDNFMESHERRRYYIEILYTTSVFGLCPGRRFISWTVFLTNLHETKFRLIPSPVCL